MTSKKIQNLSELRDLYDIGVHANEVREKETKIQKPQTDYIYQILMTTL